MQVFCPVKGYTGRCNYGNLAVNIMLFFSLTACLLCKYFVLIDNKYNNEWMNEWMTEWVFATISLDQQVNKLQSFSSTTKCRRLKLRLGNTFSSTQFSVL